VGSSFLNNFRDKVSTRAIERQGGRYLEIFVSGEIGSLNEDEARCFVRIIFGLVNRNQNKHQQVRLHFGSLSNLDLFVESILSPMQKKFEEIDFQLFCNFL
jgi:hypothetical protein